MLPGSPIMESSSGEEEEELDAAGRPSRVGRSRSFKPPPIFLPCVCSYLEEYNVHLVGALPKPKHVENCGSKMTCLKTFLTHLSEGKSELDSWQFMDDVRKIMVWPSCLEEQGKAITTSKVYLVNVT